MDFKGLEKEINNEKLPETKNFIYGTVIPLLSYLIPYLIVLYVFNWISDNHGFEKAIIIILTAILFSIRYLIMVVKNVRNGNIE